MGSEMCIRDSQYTGLEIDITIGSSIQVFGIFYVFLRKELDEKDVLSSFQLYVLVEFKSY